MRAWCGVVLAVMLSAAVSHAQDEPKPEQLKKMYDDALAQLKSAQIAKTELAGENEKLVARVAELEKQLAEARGQADDLKKEAAGWSERTFFLRSHYTAWQAFLRQHPVLKVRWDVFLENQVPAVPGNKSGWVDRDWPLSAEG